MKLATTLLLTLTLAFAIGCKTDEATSTEDAATTAPGAVGAAALVAGAQASAQSAADKATARQLAVRGIELYNDGKYAEALPLLKRAVNIAEAYLGAKHPSTRTYSNNLKACEQAKKRR